MRFLLAGILAAASLAAAGCGSGGGGSTTAAAGGGGEAVSIGESEFALDPSTVHVEKSGTVTFTITNNGKVDHAFEVEGQGVEEKTDTIKPGGTANLTVQLSKSGEYEFYCPVDGHRGLGMRGTLTLGAGGGGATTGGQDGTTGGGGGYGYGSG